MKFGAPVDLQHNELRNAVAHPLAGAPSSPTPGQFYYNTSTNILYSWNGSAWRPTDAAALTDGSIPNTALATNPLARGNHTGTQLSATISDLATTVQAYRLDQFAVPTVSVSFSGQQITNIADATTAQGAVSLNQLNTAVQQAAAGIDSKPSVRLVTTGNVSLTGLSAQDGVTPNAGDRILVPAQTTATQNGVYIAASGAWTRATDADQTGEITPGSFWFVEEGTTYGKTQWRCNNTGTITIGTTAITIVQFGAASSYTANNGVQLVGSNFSAAVVAGGGVTAGAGGLAVDTAVVARKFSATITGDGATSSFTVTHNLNTQDIIAMIRDSSQNAVIVDVQANGVNTCVVTFGAGSVPGSGVTFRVTVLG